MTALRQYRIQNKISMLKAARELGFPMSTLSRYETGDHFPRPDALLKIKAWSNGNVTANDFVDLRKQVEK